MQLQYMNEVEVVQSIHNNLVLKTTQNKLQLHDRRDAKINSATACNGYGKKRLLDWLVHRCTHTNGVH